CGPLSFIRPHRLFDTGDWPIHWPTRAGLARARQPIRLRRDSSPSTPAIRTRIRTERVEPLLLIVRQRVVKRLKRGLNEAYRLLKSVKLALQGLEPADRRDRHVARARGTQDFSRFVRSLD